MDINQGGFMMHWGKFFCFVFMSTLFLTGSSSDTWGAPAKPSQATETCLACHRAVTPGIVSDWENSYHSTSTPAAALEKAKRERRMSAAQVSDEVSGHVVGCAECHTANPDAHPDTFDHNGFKVHTVVTPADCAVCHPTEVDQYSHNIMAQAYGNLNHNPVYHDLVEMSIGTQKFANGELSVDPPNIDTESDACNYCHGTVVEFQGLEERSTGMGTMSLPKYSGWPNQGVGRINPDGTKGSCAACHTRHNFSIEMARKPYTCGECHKGPDVPAYKVYMVSKHGNIYNSHWKDWDFKAVPWVAGEDFTAPTCATCHASLVVTPTGEVISERTHQFNDRSAWRIFGLPYAHAHPKDADTTKIKNSDGLPLPTSLDGTPATEYLIDENEQNKRRATMKRVCSACHSEGWTNGHFERFENTIQIMNEKTLTSTGILLEAYNSGVANGLADGDSLFNEALEKKWVETWLFYANSTRFSSAMAGADYGVFANGRWYMNKTIAEMADWLEMLKKIHDDED
ncbi:hydroxylamine oxidase [Geoalkalibacter subterraneus]|uniref:Hydroxylamine oxidase n=2 Tax=Geoalkalibacter subterraneus TaxID=483547 RepID=A0A0B5FUI7_9BACT|nr:hydroxylamine oxidase [Geoalkalibacter subterraneus]